MSALAMNRTQRGRVLGAGILLVLALVLAACGGQAVALPAPTQAAAGQASSAAPAQPAADLSRTNEGGAVTFVVTPRNLDASSGTLDFYVSMNTHSVDLGFDLAKMSVLKTDTGAEIAPSAYQGGSGHHVRGLLSFPAAPAAGARTLTLVISNAAGVAERTFTWERP